jgi:hypothetical protein
MKAKFLEKDLRIASWVGEIAMVQALIGTLHCIRLVIDPTHGWSAYFIACQSLSPRSSQITRLSAIETRTSHEIR